MDILLNKLPPQNIDMEESVLSAIFINPKGIEEIEDLSPNDFYKGAHKKIFSAILWLKDHKEPIDLMTITAELKKREEIEGIGGVAYLAMISDCAPVATNIKTYATKIMELAKARELIIVASEIQDAGFNAKNIEQYISESQSKILNIQTTTSKDRFYGMDELIHNTLDQIETAQNSEFETGLNFGMPKLDNFMQVWGPKLILLAGRPGMGKSSLAFSIAVRLGYQEEAVGVLPIEMDKEQFTEKVLSAGSNINSMIFHARKSISTDGFKQLYDAAELLSTLPIHVDDSGCNLEDVKRKCRKFKKMGKKLIIIDQLNTISIERGIKTYDGISRNCSELKQLTKELRTPILLLCQLNRDLEKRNNKRPLLSDLAETGRLEQDADMVLFLYRDGKYNKETDESVTEIDLAKNRQGKTGVERQVLFIKKRGMFQLI